MNTRIKSLTAVAISTLVLILLLLTSAEAQTPAWRLTNEGWGIRASGVKARSLFLHIERFSHKAS